MEGQVKWFNNSRGYGFICYEDDQEIFVHYTGIEAEGYKSLKDSQHVEFDIVEGSRGPQATNVKVIDPETPSDENVNLDDFYNI